MAIVSLKTEVQYSDLLRIVPLLGSKVYKEVLCLVSLRFDNHENTDL